MYLLALACCLSVVLLSSSALVGAFSISLFLLLCAGATFPSSSLGWYDAMKQHVLHHATEGDKGDSTRRKGKTTTQKGSGAETPPPQSGEETRHTRESCSPEIPCVPELLISAEAPPPLNTSRDSLASHCSSPHRSVSTRKMSLAIRPTQCAAAFRQSRQWVSSQSLSDKTLNSTSRGSLFFSAIFVHTLTCCPHISLLHSLSAHIRTSSCVCTYTHGSSS